MTTSLLADTIAAPWVTVSLAALNVIQTIVLAYLAAAKLRNGRQ